MGRARIIVLLSVLVAGVAYSQPVEAPAAPADASSATAGETGTSTPATSTPPATAPAGASTSSAGTKKDVVIQVEPVYPPVADGLTWIESEDAVTTNFANDAVLDYDSSGFRMLQLNREGGSKSAPFYAEYAVVIEKPGTYAIWIGGTPPGPQAETVASFVSPLRLTIDDSEQKLLYREQVAVNERYSTIHYWFVLKENVQLDAGIHTFRFEVAEPRKYDNRFYYYLDAFFLLRDGSEAALGTVDRAVLPGKFPKDLADRRIDSPYLSIPQYEYSITANPKDPNRYLLLAQVYSLLGDNGSAVKTLSRGRVVAGDDIRFILQSAKSRIYMGEIDEGLRLYREYLASPDAERAIWAEAAKISAWLMKYQESEDLYRQAMSKYPDDMNLRLNYALTLLWQGKVKDGETELASLWKVASQDAARVGQLGELYYTSGYPERAIEIWTAGSALFPDHLDLYLRLMDAYTKTDQAANATAVATAIRTRFVPSPRLEGVLQAMDQKAKLKEDSLERYRARLREDPDNLALRQELLRAYYWNGKIQDALGESYNILANKLYTILGETDTELAETWRLLDQLSMYRPALATFETRLKTAQSLIAKHLDTLVKAKARNDQAQKGKDAKRKQKAELELAAAQAALAGQLEWATYAMDWLDWVRPEALATSEAAVIEAAAREADMTLASKLAPWTWTADSELAFLAPISAGNPLAYHAETFIRLLYGMSAPVPFSGEGMEPTGILAMRRQLWESGGVDSSIDPAAYGVHGQELADISATLLFEPYTEGTYDESTEASARNMLVKMTDALASMPADRTNLAQASDALLARAKARLVVRMYQYDSEAQQDRREQADVLLRLDRPADAVHALDRVLAVSPTDSSSLFTIGRALEMSGNWSRAQKSYRLVYDLNPRYESASSSYNRLARAHPLSLSSGMQTLLDTDEVAVLSTLSVALPVNSVLSASATYSLDHHKLHLPADGEVPESYTAHSLMFGVPLSWYTNNIVLNLEAGGILLDRLQSFLPPSINNFSAGYIMDYVAVAPRLGASLVWKEEGLELGGSYGLHQLPETYYPASTAYYEHDLGAYGQYYKEVPARKFARVLAGRFSAGTRVVFVPGQNPDNLIVQINAEGRIGNELVASPALTADLGVALSYQTSTQDGATGYYAPDNVITFKAGPAFTVRHGNERTVRTTASLRLWPGVYSADGSGRFAMDGAFSVGLERLTMTMGLDVSGSYTAATASDAAWWTGSLGLYGRVSLGDYIIP